MSKRKFRKRLWIPLILFLALLITLPILLIKIENYRGGKEWQRVEKEIVAAGISLDPKSYLEELPDDPDQNFGALPLIASNFDFPQAFELDNPADQFDEEGNHRYANPELRERFVRMTLPVRDNGNRESGEMTDLKQWIEDLIKHEENILTLPQDGTPAERLLAAMHAESGQDLQEIDRAAHRPRAVAKTVIGENFLQNIHIAIPWLSDMRKHVFYQKARAIAALENGDPQQAVAAVRVMVKCGRVAGSSPVLVAHLIEMSYYQLAFSVVWHGIETGEWEVVHYEELEEILAGVDKLFERAERAMTFEMVSLQIGGADFLRDDPAAGARLIEETVNAGGARRQSSRNGFRFIPDGTFDFNKSLGCEMMLRHAILPLRHEDPALLRDEIELPEGLFRARYFLVAITLPAVTNIAVSTFRCETARRQAITSCAIERYRLANKGILPEKLDDLVPEFLPAIFKDPMSLDSLLKYKKTEKGYKIISDGHDGIDDEGTIVWKGKRPDREKGDWVWGIPAERAPNES